jgi:hypothetical protein
MEEYTCLVDKVLALEIRPQVQDLPQSESTERCNSEPSKVLDTFAGGDCRGSVSAYPWVYEDRNKIKRPKCLKMGV